MIPERDVWAAALLLVKRYGADAGTEAAKRADQLLAEGDVDGCATWKRIVKAVEDLQAKEPNGGRLN